MSQPRKSQIKSVNTHYSLVPLTVTPGVASQTITSAYIDPYLVTDIDGGVEVDIEAIVVSSTIGPYPLGAGKVLRVTVDANAPVDVTFAGTDTSTSRIASTINTALGAAIASNNAGYLVLKSLTKGDASQIILQDIAGGPTFDLDMPAGTYTGASAGSIRGVVTRTSDLLGGRIPIKTTDGKTLVTDGNALLLTTVTTCGIDIAGGVPVYGAITRPTVDYSLSYYADLPPRVEVITFGSTFSDLDGTDSVDLTIDGILSTITFPAFPYTRDQVVNRINAVYAPSGSGYCISSIPSPWSFNGESIDISVDGAAPVNVPLGVGQYDATTLAAQINGLVVNQTTLPSINGTIGIFSNNTNGRTSSITINSSTDTLKKLGISAGVYRGLFIAEPYGPDEVKISSRLRGTAGSITIGGFGVNTATRLGLTAGVVAGTDIAVSTPVTVPVTTPLSPTDPYTVNLLVPEVLEFGEVPSNYDSVSQQFGVKSSGSNVNVASLILETDPYSVVDPGFSRGIADSGKTPTLNARGEFDYSYLSSAVRYPLEFLKRIISGNFTTYTVSALVAPGIEVPGTNGNLGTSVSAFHIDIDPATAWGDPSLNVRFNRDGVAVSPFVVHQNSAVFPYNYTWESDTTIRFRDENIAAAAAISGEADIPFSGNAASGGDYARLDESPILGTGQSTRSVLEMLNARWTVTVGDGVDTFGDFNGSTAISDALAFHTANFADKGLTILVKRGTYNLDKLTLGEGDFSIIGCENIACKLQNTATYTTDDDDGAIILNHVASRLTLENIYFQNSGSTSRVAINSLISNQTIFKRCTFSRQALRLSQNTTMQNVPVILAQNCNFSMDSGDTYPCLIFDMKEAGNQLNYGYKFESCSFITPTDYPALRIKNVGVITNAIISGLLFKDCKFRLRGTTTNVGNLTGNCGVLELVPAAGGSLTVNDITYENCNVDANINGLTNSILLYLRSEDAVGHITINNFNIVGGRWRCPNQGTGITPFYVGGATYDSTSYVKNISIRNVAWGFAADNIGSSTSVGYGVATTETVTPNSYAAAFFIHVSGTVEMKNVEWLTYTAHPGSVGDLSIYKPSTWAVDGVYLKNIVDTAALGDPLSRVKLESDTASLSNGSVRNIHVIGNASLVASVGVLYITPNGSLELENCVIQTHATHGIYIERGAGSVSRGLSISGCKIQTLTGDGIYYLHPGIAGSDPLEDLSITNNRISACTRAINLRGLSAGGNAVSFRNIRILGNTIYSCTSFGILYAPGDWTYVGPSNAVHSFMISNNNIQFNNGSVAAIQVQFGVATSADGDEALGVMMGNDCALGQIYFKGGAPISAGGSVYGVETGHSAAPTTLLNRSFTGGDPILNNRAILTIAP